MSQRIALRQLRKEVIKLQSQHYRMALQQDLAALGSVDEDPADSPGPLSLPRWADLTLELLTTILPARWSRRLNLVLVAWRVGKQFVGKRAEKV